MATVDTTLSTALTVRSTQVTLAAYTAPVSGFGARTLLLVNNAETMEVLSSIGRTLTVQRGFNGTTALAHAAGVTVTYGLSTEMTGPSVVAGPSGPQAVIDSASVDWTFGSGVGSAAISAIHQATVTLTNTQIKALPSTAVDLVAAQGANTVIVPVVVSFVLDVSAGAYIADVGSSWILMDAAGDYLSSPLGMRLRLQATTLQFGVFPPSGFLDAAVPDFGAQVVVGSDVSFTGAFTNLALQIKDDWNGVANYAGGHASNTLKVSTVYLVLNTSTGAYI